MHRHPAKHELLAFAEDSLVAGRTISAQLGSHIARCKTCRAEVVAMRETLWTASFAAHIEPSREFTARVLMAGKHARQSEQRRRMQPVSFVTLAKGFGYAAALLLVAGTWFSAASTTSAAPAEASASAGVTRAVAAVAPTPEDIGDWAAQIQTFAAAVNVGGGPQGLQALQYQRMARALGADLMEAQAALKRNPGSARASDVVTLNLRRSAETWKALYLMEHTF